MNYAWANPVTGLREQTRQSKSTDPAELEALKAEARLRAWEELQSTSGIPTPGSPLTVPLPAVVVCEQIHAGSVTQSGDQMDPEAIKALDAWDDFQWAWAHPLTGLRQTQTKWPSHLKDVLASDPVGFTAEVLVYASRPAFTVMYGDSKPEAPPIWDWNPPPISGEIPGADLQALRIEVQNFIDLEGGNPAPKVTALALLDIAQSLRTLISGATVNEVIARQKLETFNEYFEALEPVCQCIGDGLLPDGSPCVCPEGMARKRAQAVKQHAEQPPPTGL